MQFLRGDFKGAGQVIRPPWAIPEAEFVERCSRCKACVAVCPEQIIVRGRGGFPSVDFSLGECSFCAECVNSCPDAVLICDKQDTPPWQLRAHVEAHCLTHQKIVCVSCKEACDASAIQMQYIAGAVAIPVVDASLCTGCGACYQPCPANAISIKDPEFTPLSETEDAVK